MKAPPQAAALIQALVDAETGVAQTQKGSHLDETLDGATAELVLEDGEVLKLPPLPDQMEEDYGDEIETRYEDKENDEEYKETMKSLQRLSANGNMPVVAAIQAQSTAPQVLPLGPDQVLDYGADAREEETVHAVYESIAPHFSNTRYKVCCHSLATAYQSEEYK